MIDVVANLTVRPVPQSADALAKRDVDFSSFVEAAVADDRPRRDVETKSVRGEPQAEVKPKPLGEVELETAAPDAAAVQAPIALADATPPVAQAPLGGAAPPLALPAAAPIPDPLQAVPAAAAATAAAATAQAAAQAIGAGAESGRTPSPASALAAAGVTELSGEIVVETPVMARPAAPPPSPAQPAEAASSGPQVTDAAATPADAKPDPASIEAVKPDADPGADVGDPAPATAHLKPETPAGSAPADRAQPMLQTAAAPATSVGQNTQASAGANAAVAAQVAVQVATDIAHGAGARRTRFEIRLDPDDLGRIDVRLDIGHDGRIATRLIVEKAETLDLLKQDSRELQRQLEQSGFQLGQSGLSFQLKDGRRDDWQALADLNGLPAASPEPGEETPPAVEAYARAARRGGAGVDVTA